MKWIKYIFLVVFICIWSYSQAQIGEPMKKVQAVEDSLGSRLIKVENGVYTYIQNNVNYFYEFKGGACTNLKIIAPKLSDYELKGQLYKRGYRLNDDYEYQREDQIADFKYLEESKFVQVTLRKTFKRKAKLSIMDSIDKYLMEDAKKYSNPTAPKKDSTVVDTATSMPTPIEEPQNKRKERRKNRDNEDEEKE
jgi:hypothetical protein